MAEAIYKVKDPSGNVREIRGPEGATDEQVLAQAKTLFGKAESKEDQLAALRKEITDEMPWHQQALAGIGKAIVDTGRGVRQLAAGATDFVAPRKGESRTDVLRAEEAATREQDAALMNTGAGMTGNVAGNVALMLAPGGALKAAGTVARLGGATETAAALSKAGGVLLAPKTVTQAVPVGAAMGLVQPSTSTKETLTNTGVGAVATGAVPLVVKAGQLVKAAAEPFYEGGQRAIAGRLLNRVAGDSAPAAQANLAAARELVPGSAPTAGQASGNAGIAATERAAAAIDPAATTAYAERMTAQSAARNASLETISGTQAEREAAKGAREAAAGPLYKQARAEAIDPDVAKMLKPQIENLMERVPGGVLEKAKELARVNGEKLDGAGSINGLHWMKVAVDDLISGAGEKGLGKESKKALLQYKGDLLSVIDELSPAYKAAREKFAELSKPINQMQVGAKIAETKNALTGNLQPVAFAKSLSDKTAQAATKFKGSTLANTVDAPNLAKLQAIKEDLARAEAAKNGGRGVGSDTLQKLAYSNFIDAAGVPTFLRNLAPLQVGGNLAARGADALYGRANKEMASRLAQIMLDPKESAAVMKIASKPGNEKLLQLLTQSGTASGIAATPALVNLQQQ